MVTSNYKKSSPYTTWQLTKAQDNRKSGIWWNVRGIFISDFFNVKSGIFTDHKVEIWKKFYQWDRFR